MLEAIVVVVSIVGCLMSWYTLHQYKHISAFVELYTNRNVVLAGSATTMIIAAVAAYFGWVAYATLCLASIPLDWAVKRVILR